MPILDLLIRATNDPPGVPYANNLDPTGGQRRIRYQGGEIVDVRIDAQWQSPLVGYGVVPLLSRKWRIIRVTDALEGDEDLVRAQDALRVEDVGKGFLPRIRLYRLQLNDLPSNVKNNLIPRKYPDVDHQFFLNHPGIRARLLEKYPGLSTLKANERRSTPWDLSVTRAQIIGFLKKKVDEPRDLSGFPIDDQETDQQIDIGDDIR